MIDDKGGNLEELILLFIHYEYLVPYWKLPKRAPTPLDFDINNKL